jgi:hypothetical protein
MGKLHDIHAQTSLDPAPPRLNLSRYRKNREGEDEHDDGPKVRADYGPGIPAA